MKRFTFKIEEIIDIPRLEDEDVHLIRFKLKPNGSRELKNKNIYYDLPILMRAVKKNDTLALRTDGTEYLFTERDNEFYVAHYAYDAASFSRKGERNYFCVRGEEMADLLHSREEEELSFFKKFLKDKSG